MINFASYSSIIRLESVGVMDSGRLALYKPLGLQEWQLRRPELLTLQGELPVRPSTANSTAEWTLWLLGEPPRWLGDLCCLFPLQPRDCCPWSADVTIAPNDAVLVLDPASPAPLPGVVGSQLLDARGGKRQLWLQLCTSGRLQEVIHA